MQPLTQRFAEQVAFVGATDDDCWLWDGATSAAGYGQLGVGGYATYVHRMAWEWRHGAIPHTHDIHHTCDNRRCVNTAHMELLDKSEHGYVSAMDGWHGKDW